jgi:hypothetical protein
MKYTGEADLHDLRHLVAGDFDYFLKIRVGDMEGSTASTASSSSHCPACGRPAPSS